MRDTAPDQRYRRGSVFLELSRTTAILTRLFERELVRTGVRRRAQGMLLTLIHIHGPITPTHLERESGLAGTTLRENVQALLDARLVRRLPNPRDGRSYPLDTTKQGQSTLDASVPAMRAVEEAVERELGRPLESYRESIERLRDAAQAADKALSPVETTTVPR